MPIGVSSAPYVKFENKGDRHGGEIVDFRVVQNRDVKSRAPLYLEEQPGGGWKKVERPFAADGRPNDPICQWEVTVDTGVEDENGDTERRIFIDPRKGRRGTTVEGKRSGDAIANALKRAKSHRVGLEIGGRLFLTFEGKVNDGEMKTNTWSAEYEPPPGGPGTGTPVDEVPWLVGGARFDKQAEMAQWKASQGQAAMGPTEPVPTASEPEEDPDLQRRQQEAVQRLKRDPQTPAADDEEIPF